jgi:pimeloyl-ACP methyl ester carboxylesterase
MEGFSGRDPLATLRANVPNLRRVTKIDGAGHLVQLERSTEVNDLITAHLRELVPVPVPESTNRS